MNFRETIKELVTQPLYDTAPAEHAHQALPLFRACIEDAAERHAGYGRYVSSWPVPLHQAERISDLPFLPVSVFKRPELLSLLAPGGRQRVVTSSGTTAQVPSRIVLDTETAKLMSLGALQILRNFIGSHRRPYLVIDCPSSSGVDSQLNARSAAIRALMPLATQWHACLTNAMQPDVDQLKALADQYRDQPILIYGFTYILWFHFAAHLEANGITLNLPHAMVLHSGGWKRMAADSIDKEKFCQSVGRVIGCRPDQVIDFYGLVENIGVAYPDCEYQNKHVPHFADITIRIPQTMGPVCEGETGIIQVGSLLPLSFPGHLLLTEDLGTVVHYDGCPCGRRGLAFRVHGRVPRAELRGCGDVLAHKFAA
jgi:phenylacetate-coenzyme A ligase PaaK-like adenylate-forming protein